MHLYSKNKLIYHLFVESGWESHNDIIVKLKWLDSRCPILLLLHLLLSSWMFLDCYFMNQKPDAFWEVYSQRALQSSTDQHFKTVIHLLDSYGQHKAGGWSWFGGWASSGTCDLYHWLYESGLDEFSRKSILFWVWAGNFCLLGRCNSGPSLDFEYLREEEEEEDKRKKKGRYCGMKLARPGGSGRQRNFVFFTCFFASCSQFFVRMLQN